MIKYFETKEEQHKNDLLLHLRAHNKSFTGEKLNEQNYIYVLENDVLLGGLKSNLSWDWVGLNDVFYSSTEVLKELLAKACNIYKEKAVGLKLITKDKTKHSDFIELGFYDQGTVITSPLSGLNYFCSLNDLNIEDNSKFHTISSKEYVNEYDIIHKKKQEEYKSNFNEQVMKDTVTYVAYDNDVFAGGVLFEIYEDSIYVDLLAVNKEYRGNNVGTELMMYVEAYAKEKEIQNLDLGTTQFQARAFYEKLGYKVVFTRQNFPKGFECYTLIKKLTLK